MNLNQVSVPSHDVPESIAFYKALGLELIVHTHDRYARFQCPVGDSTLSVEWTEQVIRSGVKVYFEVADLDRVYERLCATGIEFETKPKDQPWLWREAQLKDPFNNTIVLFSAGKNRKDPPWKLDQS
ncbi:MAG: VOC family protein [Cryomorphaceae bacterium]